MSRASVAAVLVLLAVVLGHPFLARPLDVIPGDPVLGEAWLQPWSVWWVHHEIFREGTFPFWTDLLNYPQGGAFFSQMTLNALLLLPLGPLDLPSTLLLNLSLLVTLLLGGFFTFRLLEHLTKDQAAALAGTAVFMTCPLLVSFFRSGYLQGLNLVWVPLAWYLYLRMDEQPTPRRALQAAAGMAVLVLANFYAAIAAGLLVGLHALWHRRAQPLFLLAAVLLSLPLVVWIGRTLQVSPLIFASSGISNETFFQYSNPDLLRFLLPRGEGDYFHLTECYYLGLAALSFAFVPWRKGPQAAFYGVVTLLGVVLALGPYLVVDGSMVLVDNHLVRLPFYYVYRYVPFFDVVRHPQRLMVLVYLALAVLIALRLKGQPRWAALLVAGLCVGEYLFVAPVVFPVPVSPARPADYCAWLRERPGAVVALPDRTQFVQGAWYKHQQTFHGRSLQVGFDRHDPPQLQDVRFLQALSPLEDAPGDVDRLVRLGFRYVVLDPADDPATVQGLTRLLGPPQRFQDGLVFPLPEASRFTFREVLGTSGRMGESPGSR